MSVQNGTFFQHAGEKKVHVPSVPSFLGWEPHSHTHTLPFTSHSKHQFLNNVPFFFLGGALLQLYSSGAERKSGARKKTHYPPPSFYIKVMPYSVKDNVCKVGDMLFNISIPIDSLHIFNKLSYPVV